MPARELRIGPDRPLEKGLRKRRIRCREAVEMTQTDMIIGPGVQVFRVAQPREARLVQGDAGLERRDQVRHDPRPQVPDLVDWSHEPVRPEDLAARGFGQFQRHRDGAVRAFDDPRQDVARRQRGRHQIEIGLHLPEAEGRAARDHREPAQPRQGLDDLMRDRIAQNGELRRHAERLEGQHGDRGTTAGMIGRVRRRGVRICFCGAHDAHFGDKAEAPAVNSVDHRLMRAVVIDRLTGRADAAGDARVRDRLPLPDRGDDLVLGHHAISVPDKMDEQGKHLRLQPHKLVGAGEFKSFRVESEVSECPSHP